MNGPEHLPDPFGIPPEAITGVVSSRFNAAVDEMLADRVLFSRRPSLCERIERAYAALAQGAAK